MVQDTDSISTTHDALALLQWYADAGVDEAVQDTPQDYFALAQAETKPQSRPPHAHSTPPSRPAMATASTPGSLTPAASIAPRPTPAHAPLSASPLTKDISTLIAEAQALADGCTTLDALRSAVEQFEGCSLKKLASRTVFADGTPQSRVMCIGEAPGADEDREGIPFCGVSGKLLDRMLASIGLHRSENVYISNMVFWRPPGNRNPSAEELAICRPFVEKHIALIQPQVLILVGGVSAQSLLQETAGITRLRGKKHLYHNPLLETPMAAYALFHPSYLLRQPAHKALAWKDLLAVRQLLDDTAP